MCTRVFMQRAHSVMEARSAVLISLHARILWSLQFQRRASSFPLQPPSTVAACGWNKNYWFIVDVRPASMKFRKLHGLHPRAEALLERLGGSYLRGTNFFHGGWGGGEDGWFIERDDFRRLVEESVLRVGWRIETRVDWKINNSVDRVWMILSRDR